MATLVLTTVGRAIGGPIGGALGALAGQAIDARLFRGAVREGPRLTELAVQTSSYGAQLPKLFGTMRVAGTVIWSTDLIETRTASRSGKGQPGTNTYTYTASFAVALSARPIRGVRRIWAEGKLLRGAAGDWKGRTGFRLHMGGEDQAVDPLIASAMGATPAYRGLAYAVFEGLQLADYGNRIPSLTFEVVADDGPVASGDIAATLAGEISASGGTMLGGFAASGASVRGVLDTLAVLDGGWWQPDGGYLVRRSDRGAALSVTDAGIDRAGRRRDVAASADAPREIAVSHYDPARDYQIGVQRVRRPGPGERLDRIELPAVLDAPAAKTIAAALVVRGEARRIRRRVALGVEGLAIAPGAIVSISGETGRWRVEKNSVAGFVATLDIVPLPPTPLAMSASSGTALGAPDLAVGRTTLIAAELPPPPDSLLGGPRISVLTAGEGAGWRQAALLYSLDDGASWIAAGGSAAPATLGRIENAPVAASSLLIDRRSRVIVALLREDMTLGDADAASRAGMGNLALIGDEVIQFERAEPLGDARWLLSGLHRGLRGTEAAIGTQSSGDRFALLESDAVAAIDLPLTTIGRQVSILASGVGDTDAPIVTTVMVAGASVAPPSPVHARAREGAGGALELAWVRRSRQGWGWADGADAPLAEEAEAYRVKLVTADGGERTTLTGAPRLTIAAADRPTGRVTVGIVQLGTHAASLPATLILERGV